MPRLLLALISSSLSASLYVSYFVKVLTCKLWCMWLGCVLSRAVGRQSITDLADNQPKSTLILETTVQ